MLAEILFEGINCCDLEISPVSAIMGGDTLDSEETGTVHLCGIQGMSLDEEIEDTLTVGVLDFKIDVQT